MERKQPHACNLRKGRVSIPGQVYLGTAVCRRRMPVFASFDAARTLIRILRNEHCRGSAQTLCFVVMPDHLHWLLVLGEGESLSAVVRRVKALMSKRSGLSVWQKGFHDHALRREEDVQTVARYVVANPLRAGLVERLGEYPHWDAMWL
jgi:REP element-mobilizing transposase RayT